MAMARSGSPRWSAASDSTLRDVIIPQRSPSRRKAVSASPHSRSAASTSTSTIHIWKQAPIRASARSHGSSSSARKASSSAYAPAVSSGTPAKGAQMTVRAGYLREIRPIPSTITSAAATCSASIAESGRSDTPASTPRTYSSSSPSGAFGPSAASTCRAEAPPS